MHRPEGDGSGRIVYDFKNRAVELHDLVSQIDVAQVAPIMGPKFTEYTKPYHFAKPPLVHANGLVDLQDKKENLDTDLVVQVDAKSPMELDALPHSLRLRPSRRHAHLQEPPPAP